MHMNGINNYINTFSTLLQKVTKSRIVKCIKICLVFKKIILNIGHCSSGCHVNARIMFTPFVLLL